MQLQPPRFLEHPHGLPDLALPPVHHPQVVVGGGMAGVFLGRPAVGVLGSGQVPLLVVQVPQPEQDLGLGLAVAKRVEKQRDPLCGAVRTAEILGLGKSALHELAPLRGGQTRGVGQRSAIRSFTVWMSSHVWCLGLPLALLALRNR